VKKAASERERERERERESMADATAVVPVAAPAVVEAGADLDEAAMNDLRNSEVVQKYTSAAEIANGPCAVPTHSHRRHIAARAPIDTRTYTTPVCDAY
jgi:hypothetical protein